MRYKYVYILDIFKEVDKIIKLSFTNPEGPYLFPVLEGGYLPESTTGLNIYFL